MRSIIVAVLSSLAAVSGAGPSIPPSVEAALDAAASSLPKCESKRTSDPVRTFMALNAGGATEQATACLLQLLHKSSNIPAWALAGAVTSDSTVMDHAASLLRGKSGSRTPAAYDVLGPFPIGKNEVDGDPVEGRGGALAHWLEHYNLTRRAASSGLGHVESEIVPGGRVGWETRRTAPDGSLHLTWPDQPWGGLVQAMGQRAVLEVQAWTIGALAVVADGHFRLDCKGTHKAFIVPVLSPQKDRVVAGDIYRSSPFGGGGFGVGLLRRGAYLVLMRLRTVVQAAATRARHGCAVGLWRCPCRTTEALAGCVT
jgi:hypothetical protein